MVHMVHIIWGFKHNMITVSELLSHEYSIAFAILLITWFTKNSKITTYYNDASRLRNPQSKNSPCFSDEFCNKYVLRHWWYKAWGSFIIDLFSATQTLRIQYQYTLVGEGLTGRVYPFFSILGHPKNGKPFAHLCTLTQCGGVAKEVTNNRVPDLIDYKL